MTFEDEIRDAMRAHDAEAPLGSELVALIRPGLQTPRHARRPQLVAVAAAVLLIVGLAAAVGITRGRHASVTGSQVDGNGALLCPGKYQQRKENDHGPLWVPAKANGVPAATRLAPVSTPAQAVVCGYTSQQLGANQRLRLASVPLTGRHVLGGSLIALATTLSSVPPAREGVCSDYLTGTDGDDYLIGLTYPSGTLWVSVPGNHCDGVSNGSFATDVNLQAYAAAAYSAGRWVTTPPADPAAGTPGPCVITTGRYGQQTAMVPGRPVRVTACIDGRIYTRLPTSRTRALVAALNQLPTTAATGFCNGRAGSDPDVYNLVFRYRSGPSVSVSVSDSCLGPVSNGSLRATELGNVDRLIAELPR